MAERPILFSTPMVEAILGGGKTQTRRVVSPANSVLGTGVPWARLEFSMDNPLRQAPYADGVTATKYLHVACRPHPNDPQDDDTFWSVHRVYPRINAGDTLWVRETFANMEYECNEPSWTYKAGAPSTKVDGWALPPGVRWKPGIHMPRRAARILLRVETVRAERLQSISETEAMAEGWRIATKMPPVEWYRQLWDDINAARGYRWLENPLVWVIEFARQSE